MRRARLVPLFLDCVALRGHSDIVISLLGAGADTSIKNSDGKTALDVAPHEGLKTILRDWPSLGEV